MHGRCDEIIKTKTLILDTRIQLHTDVKDKARKHVQHMLVKTTTSSSLHTSTQSSKQQLSRYCI